MRYPIYIHPGDTDHAFGVIVPDFPGCFSAADDEDDLPAAVQEALELYCEDEDLEIPTPSRLVDLMASPDYQDGAWAWIEVDVSRLRPKKARYNVYLSRSLVAQVDAIVEGTGLNRSAFLAMAAMEKIERERS